MVVVALALAWLLAGGRPGGGRSSISHSKDRGAFVPVSVAVDGSSHFPFPGTKANNFRKWVASSNCIQKLGITNRQINDRLHDICRFEGLVHVSGNASTGHLVLVENSSEQQQQQPIGADQDEI